MTQLCVAIFVTDADAARRDVALAAEAGAEVVELRIDEARPVEVLLEPLPHEQVASETGIPSIVTCRPQWEGGQSELADEQRIDLLMAVAKAGASYVDVELAVLRKAQLPAANKVLEMAASPRDTRAGLIVSSHDFAGRPPRLATIVQEIWDSPADVAKVVWTARTIRDNLEAFEILINRQK